MVRILASAALAGAVALSVPANAGASAYDLLNGTFNLTPGELFSESLSRHDEGARNYTHAITPCAYHHETVQEKRRSLSLVNGGKPLSELTIDPNTDHEFIAFKAKYIERVGRFFRESRRRYDGSYGQCVLNDQQRLVVRGVTDERDPRNVNRQWQRRHRTYFTGYNFAYNGGHRSTYGCGCGRPWMRNASEDILRHHSLNNGGAGSGGGVSAAGFSGIFSGGGKAAAAAPSPPIETAVSLAALPLISGASTGTPEFASLSPQSRAAFTPRPEPLPPAVPLPASWLFLASALSLFAFGGWKPRV